MNAARAARALTQAFFLDTPQGPRYCIHHRPAQPPSRGALLYVHPFAEEMNKSRRMASVAARGFAERGFEVLQIDLLGCGDSPGDFGDAQWSHWLADVRHAMHWLRERSGHVPCLWGLRVGCLVSLDAARMEAAPGSGPARFLFWQPPASGRAAAQQFLRLRVAANALRQSAPGKEAGTDTPEPAACVQPTAAEPAAGDAKPVLEIAGYRLHPELLAGLQAARMQAPAYSTRSAWLEVTSRTPAELLPATVSTAAQWSTGGHAVHAKAVEGPGFWQTQEINIAATLIQVSADWLIAQG